VSAALPAGATVVHVVDDHALSRKHLRTVLAFHGYTVVLSDGAAAARVALHATPPDVVLLDLQMPGESGYELLAWMRTQPALAAVPVICVTASVPNSERERVQAAGFALFLPKPITPPQRLIDAVQQVLASGAAGPTPGAGA
jgi:CheY-like chemotaxis protein